MIAATIHIPKRGFTVLDACSDHIITIQLVSLFVFLIKYINKVRDGSVSESVRI